VIAENVNSPRDLGRRTSTSTLAISALPSVVTASRHGHGLPNTFESTILI